MSTWTREAFLLRCDSGAECFALLTLPAGRPRGVLLHLPAFAEEMNKSRRMVALAAQTLAQAGWATLIYDPAGCGDSAGVLEAQTWEGWLDEIDSMKAWVVQRFGQPPLLWGLRAGCLLLAGHLARHAGQERGQAPPAPAMLWQPVFNGRQHLTQFLRIRMAADMLADADAKGVMQSMREQLAAGECVEVAGYRLPPALAEGLGSATLALPAAAVSNIFLGEVQSPPASAIADAAAQPPAALSPAARLAIERWRGSGLAVHETAVTGPAFWNTLDITTAPALLQASCAWLASLPSASSQERLRMEGVA